MLYSPKTRAEQRRSRAAFESVRRETGDVLLIPPVFGPTRALLVSSGILGMAQLENATAHAVARAGREPVVLIRDDFWHRRYLSLLGPIRIVTWDDFDEGPDRRWAEARMGSVDSIRSMLDIELDGIEVGRHAAATMLRSLRAGLLDFSDKEVREVALTSLARSVTWARQVEKLLTRVRPDQIVFPDRTYTPTGELFNASLRSEADTVVFQPGHRSDLLMLKRFHPGQTDVPVTSLSDSTWDLLKERGDAEDLRSAAVGELERSYAAGDWHPEVGTQFRSRPLAPEAIRSQLGIDPGRKVAAIFPHILWDATFYSGQDLFESYARWFLETAKAAYDNPDLDWIIKLHPAHIVKDRRDGVAGRPAEEVILEEHLGAPPKHVKLLPTGTEVATLSLFDAIDYCVTVRGTVGIEAALKGVVVLTAGTGRYDRRGFSVDSETPDEYLEKLAHIQELPEISAPARAAAIRYSYGLFVLRPLELTSVAFGYKKDEVATPYSDLKVTDRASWEGAADIGSFAAWLQSDEEDYLTGDYFPSVT